MKKLSLLIALMSTLAIIGILVITRSLNSRTTSELTFGIIQTISHPALDSARIALEAQLKHQLGDRISCIVHNAEGSIATAQTIAQSLHRDKNIKAIATIGTLATQAAAQVEQEKPIIYCAVSDPATLGLPEHTTNVAGLSDNVDIAASADALQALCPTARTVAIIYNPSEVNSVAVVKRMDAELDRRSLTKLHVGVTSESEVLTAVSTALRNADVLWIPTDNTVACVMPAVGTAALEAHKPVIICDKNLVTPGILAAAGSADYSLQGTQAAMMIVQRLVLSTEHIHPCASGSSVAKIQIHRATAQTIGITIPHAIADRIEWINTQERGA